jgi:uncharacterized protein YndB with AHSA1/START domain
MAAAPSETSVVEHEVRIAARPETVFEFFTDPAKMVQWMGAEATLDPRPGGVCRIVFKMPDPIIEFIGAGFAESRASRLRPDGVNPVLGEFVEVDPHRRIAFTWGYEKELFAMPPQSTAVEVILTPDGEGTILRLIHRRLPTGAAAFHYAGWDHFLPRLALAAGGGDPGPDPWQAPPKG